MADAKMDGKERVKALFRKLGAEALKDLDAQAEAEAEDLAAALRRVAPERSGRLLRSIRVEKTPGRQMSYLVKIGGVLTRKKVRAGVGDSDFAKAKASGGNKGEYDYAEAIEFGHMTLDGHHVPAEPFIFPTWRSRKKAMTARMKRAARKSLNRYDTRPSKG